MLCGHPGDRTARGKRALAALLAGLVCGAGLACGDGAEGPPEDASSATVVELLKVEPEPFANVVDIPGQLASALSVEIRPEIEGILETIEFQEGDIVDEGQVLFRLRDDHQRALLRAAEAELALATATWKRTKKLAGRDVSSEAQLERAAAERDVAAARVEAARVELEQTRIRAPFHGVVGALPVSPGRQVRKTTTLVRIDAVDRLQLLFYLPERAVGVVRPGIPVKIKVAPFPEERFSGEIYFVSPTLEPEGRRFLVKAWVPNGEGRLSPGLFAEIQAEVSRHEDALMVPESALIFDLDGIYVWRVDDEDRARRVPVSLGLRREGQVEVETGLAPGDVVVAAGIHKVRAGGLVRAPDEVPSPVSAAETSAETDEGGPS